MKEPFFPQIRGLSQESNIAVSPFFISETFGFPRPLSENRERCFPLHRLWNLSLFFFSYFSKTEIVQFPLSSRYYRVPFHVWSSIERVSFFFSLAFLSFLPLFLLVCPKNKMSTCLFIFQTQRFWPQAFSPSETRKTFPAERCSFVSKGRRLGFSSSIIIGLFSGLPPRISAVTFFFPKPCFPSPFFPLF